MKWHENKYKTVNVLFAPYMDDYPSIKSLLAAPVLPEKEPTKAAKHLHQQCFTQNTQSWIHSFSFCQTVHVEVRVQWNIAWGRWCVFFPFRPWILLSKGSEPFTQRHKEVQWERPTAWSARTECSFLLFFFHPLFLLLLTEHDKVPFNSCASLWRRLQQQQFPVWYKCI